MSGELDEKAIEIALGCYSEGGCSGLDERERREVVTDIISAYLAASPSPSEMDVVGYLNWSELHQKDYFDKTARGISPKALVTLSQAYERGQESMRERAAGVAAAREAICADAVAKIDAGKLYADIPTAKATEGCARLEAAHIARQIRSLPIEQEAGK